MSVGRDPAMVAAIQQAEQMGLLNNPHNHRQHAKETQPTRRFTMSEASTLPSDTFTFACPWGCTIHVEHGVEQPHDCEGTRLLAQGMPREAAEPIARALDERLRAKYAAGYDEGRAIADLHWLSDATDGAGDAKAEREAHWNETAKQLFAHEPDTPSSYLPDGMDLSDIALFAGSAGELHRHEISGKIFFARMADRLNRARKEARDEAADLIAGQGIVGAGSHDSSVRFGFDRGLGVAVNILRTWGSRA
jgi:hypothetical protein